MSRSQETATCLAMAAIPESVSAKLYRQAGAERFGLAQQDFASILQEVAAKYLPADASPSEVLQLLTNLRVEERRWRAPAPGATKLPGRSS